MTNDVPYHFGLKIKDKEIQIGGDKIFVETQVEKWLKLFAQELPPELLPAGDGTSIFESSSPAARVASASASGPAASTGRKLPTLGEFIKTKGPKEIGDMILVIGLYLERFKQKNLFSRSDLMLTQIFARLGKTEEDVQASLVELVNKTFLTETATMGSAEMSYSLTFTGEQVVKEGFGS